MSRNDRSSVVIPAAMRALLTTESATFLIAAGLHTGLHVPLGPLTLAEPVIVPATIVEGAIGVGLGVSAYGALRRRAWAEPAAIVATTFSIVGVLLGITALALGRGPETALNTWYHRSMLGLLTLSLLYLLSRSGTTITGTTTGTTQSVEERSVSRG